jgi:hypothetical protein
MKCLKCYTILFFVFIAFAAVGQKVDLKKADAFYSRGEYFKALEIYKQAERARLPLDIETKKRIARSYYYRNDIDNAFEKFTEIMDDLTGHDVFLYANTNHRFGFYEGAIEWYEKAIKAGENPIVINELIKGCKWAEANSDFLPLLVNPSTLLTFGQSFGIQYYRDGVVYSSALEGKAGKNVDKQGMSFLNLYYSDIQNGEIQEGKRLFSENLVFPFHVGAISFTSDYNTMYFTRSVLVKNRDVLKIFSVQYDGKQWGKPVELPINSNDYDCAMPAVSPDDKFLYFVSNKKGGQGGKDLYVAEIKRGNSFGEVRNLGPNVNTFGDEVFPVVSKENVLYFSSDGHYGFGGLDIFSAEFVNGEWQNVKNMLLPYNSNYDDFGYVIDPKDISRGFLSSNRAGDRTNDVIFYVRPPIKSEEKVDDTEIRTVAGLENLRKDDVVEQPKDEPVVVVEPATVDALSKFPTHLGSLLTSTFNGSAVDGARIVVRDPATGRIIGEVVSDASGRFNIAIGDEYRKEDMEFEVEISKGNDFKPKKVIVSIHEFEDFRKSGIALTPIFNDVVLDDMSEMVIPYVDNEITSDGYLVLDRLAAYLLSNPRVVVKLNGHTEARGNRFINLTISQQVAEKAEMYLKSKGVPDENMIPRGYAERYLINKCKRGKICSDAEHLQNRRVEVVVWKMLN